MSRPILFALLAVVAIGAGRAGMAHLSAQEIDVATRVYLPIVLRGHHGAFPTVPTQPAPATATATVESVSPTDTPVPVTATTTPTRPATVTPTPLPVGCRELLEHGGFEEGPGVGWEQETIDGEALIQRVAARTGTWGARLGGRSGAQDILLSTEAVDAIDTAGVTVTLRFALRVTSEEPADDRIDDWVELVVVGDLPEAIEPVEHPPMGDDAWPPAGAPTPDAEGWVPVHLDVTSAYEAREDFGTVRLAVIALTDFDDLATTFDLDDIRLVRCAPPS